MRLADLNPRWMTIDGRTVGVNFDCPGACCAAKRSKRDTFDEGQWDGTAKLIVAVPFKVALDGGTTPWANGWERTGDTFETLTLSPSVWASPPDHWHGFIRNGEAINA